MPLKSVDRNNSEVRIVVNPSVFIYVSVINQIVEVFDPKIRVIILVERVVVDIGRFTYKIPTT